MLVATAAAPVPAAVALNPATAGRLLGKRLLGNEQEDIGFLFVSRVGVQNQPARGKTEAFPGAQTQPDRRTVGELSQKPSHQLSDRR